jgi:hypothetical protein
MTSLIGEKYIRIAPVSSSDRNVLSGKLKHSSFATATRIGGKLEESIIDLFMQMLSDVNGEL